MPRLRRRPKVRTGQVRELETVNQMLSLLFGWSTPLGDFDRERAEMFGFTTREEVEAAWEEHKHGPLFTECHPGERAWGWWEFGDAPEPRDWAVPEVVQLARLGLLAETEQEELLREFRFNAESAEKTPQVDLPLDIGHALEITGALMDEDVKMLRDIEEWKREGWRE